ncbi:Protein bric-a-brac 2 [Pseudolycoriella hygida]|uniref:Protein bric-a-brac 2 n=1 Tax=Pseudolycoriella hygida TaxID=35572 RepID=A0A9Q0S394_9DIPT|nr:Protein bric-a-brac 2 [Pseudolycoriella hygida]
MKRHLGSLGAAFPQLLAGQRFVDVTLACEGHQVHCHRLVLAACSTYFESLLGENPCKHPIIILPRDIKLWEIQALVDFMYKGEVNVSQAGLPDLLKCAEALQIRGLCGTDAALNLNNITNSTTPSSASTTNNTSLHHITANTISTTPATTSNTSSITTANSTSTTPCISRSASSSKVVIGPAVSSPGGATTGLDVTSSTSQITNILRTELLNAATIKLSAQSTTSNASSVSRAGTSISLDDGDDSANGSGSEMNIKDDEESDLKMRVDYNDDLDASSKLQSETVDEQQPPQNRHTPPDSQLATNHRQSSLHHQQHNISLVPTTSSPVLIGDDVVIVGGGSNGGGNIRVKSNENLFENYKPHIPSPHKRNQISVVSDVVTKNSVSTKYLSNTTNVSLPPPSDDDSCFVIDDDEYDEDDEEMVHTELPQLPSSLKYNSNIMTISVKPITTMKRSNQSRNVQPVTKSTNLKTEASASNMAADNFENIICSPNLIEIPYMDDEFDIDDNDAQQSDQRDSAYLCDDGDVSNTTMSNGDEPMPRLIPFGLLQTQFKNESGGFNDTKNLFAASAYRRSIENLSMTHNNGKSFNRKILLKKGMALLNNYGNSPSPSAVVLRNPRGNQPRTYTTDALYAALMDVKDATQFHTPKRK